MSLSIMRMFCVLAAMSASALAAEEGGKRQNGALTLSQALQRALAANPRLTSAERDIRISAGLSQQAAAIPNPELSLDATNILGTGRYAGTQGADTSLQISQLVELGGKREARIAAGRASVEDSVWQRQAIRLEVLSETATAFIGVVGAQSRIELLDAQINLIDQFLPQLQKRVDAGASSKAEILRAEVAGDMIRIERERAKSALATARRDLALVMGDVAPRFTRVAGQLSNVGQLLPFSTVLKEIDSNPQLMRWSAVRAQRNAELLMARLKPIPDPRIGVGWQRYGDTGDTAFRIGISVPLPVWDQNQGAISAARETLDKTVSERQSSRIALLAVAGRSHDAATGSLQELALLRSSVIPKSTAALAGVQEGYALGRYTLLELLDAQAALAQARQRDLEARLSFHVAVATLEGLVGRPLIKSRDQSR